MLSDQVDAITRSYKEKLWHQLADQLLVYTSDRVFDEGNDLIELYNCLVKDLHTKLNPLKFSLITINVSR